MSDSTSLTLAVLGLSRDQLIGLVPGFMAAMAVVAAVTWKIMDVVLRSRIENLHDISKNVEARHRMEVAQFNLKLSVLKESTFQRVILDIDFPMLNDVSVDREPYFLSEKQINIRDFNAIGEGGAVGSPWLCHESMTFIQILRDWFGEECENKEPIKDAFVRIEGEQPSCVLWKGSDFKLEGEGGGGVIKKMYPFIVLRLVEKKSSNQATRAMVDFLNWLNRWEEYVSTSRFHVEVMSAKNGFYYVRGYFEFDENKLTHSGSSLSGCRIMRQVAIIDSGRHLHVIYTGVPYRTNTKDDPYLEHIKSWWESFRAIRS